jgi:hypothetical protein
MLAALALAAALAGCGKASSVRVSVGPAAGAPSPAYPAGTVSVATKNTTRVGGPDPASDAAAVARTVYPGLTAATQPQAVVLSDERDWPGSLAASVLASAPLRAPLLYAAGGVMAADSARALSALRPAGAPALGGAQVIALGPTRSAVPGSYRVRAVGAAGASAPPASRLTTAAASAAAVVRVYARVRGAPPRQVIVLPAEASPAIQMPAAGLSAESGAPILFAGARGVPPATAAVLSGLLRPAIYVIGAGTLGASTLGALAHFGAVTPISAPTGREGPAENAIAVSRFTDGTFGWGVKEPGHGLVFANSSRPLDAPAAALLSASGQYGPLLLLESPSPVPPALAHYLSDIQPAYASAPRYQPVHGSYNHGWLIGDERAISALTQAELDSMLEIAPRSAPSEEEPSGTPPE